MMTAKPKTTHLCLLSQNEALSWVKLAAQLRQLLVCLGVVSKKSLLVSSILVKRHLEGSVFEENLIGWVRQELIICRGLLGLGEVGIVECEPVLGPGTSSRHANTSSPIFTGNTATLCVLGGTSIRVAKRACATPLFEGSTDCVGTESATIS